MLPAHRPGRYHFRAASEDIGMLRFGNEAIDRWMACAALSNPEQIAKSILWMQSPEMRSEA